MSKWEFFDDVTNTTINLEINPSSVDMGGIQKQITEQGCSAPTGQRILFEGRQQPQVIKISGTVMTKAQYQVFENWANKNYQFRLTDDLNRVYWVYITNFSPTRRRNKEYEWLTNYSIEMTVLDWP